jgi:hypothetical protein
LHSGPNFTTAAAVAKAIVVIIITIEFYRALAAALLPEALLRNLILIQ